MQFSTWSDSGLDTSQENISAVFAPFVVKKTDDSDPEWRMELKQRKRTILRDYLKCVLSLNLLRTQRDEALIIDEYSKAWHPDEYESYRLDGSPPRLSPWEYNGDRMFASDVGATRIRQLMLIRVLERVKPKRVLEVGCGNGINLLMLACRFPEIEFTGLELTYEGHQAAVGFQNQEELPTAMVEYMPLSPRDTSAFRDIRFVQGSAADLPFEDNEFDLVYTAFALEQMEGIRDKALSEVARVASRHTLMLEPFRDVNNSGWPRANVVRRQYFQGSIDDLPKYGLEPVLAVNDFPQETFLKACVVISRKSDQISR